MKRISVILVVWVLLSQIVLFSSCRKPYPACDVENPLTDLPWLKEWIDQTEREAQAGFSRPVNIYQCSYRDGTGFLFESNSKRPPSGSILFNCEGDIVCGTGSGVVYQNTCSEFHISKKRKLIYTNK